MSRCGNRRAAGSEGRLDIDPRKPVVIDETGAGAKMARRQGRARASIPRGPWKTITVVGAPRRSRMPAPMALDRAMTGDRFLAYTQRILVPTPRPDDIAILDNPPARKGVGGRQAIEAAGAKRRGNPRGSRAIYLK